MLRVGLYLWFLNTVSGLHIGLLLPEVAPSPGFPDFFSSGGIIVLAQQEVYRRYNVNINIHFRDTRCDEGVAMVRAYELATETPKADVLLGPTCARGKLFWLLSNLYQFLG